MHLHILEPLEDLPAVLLGLDEIFVALKQVDDLAGIGMCVATGRLTRCMFVSSVGHIPE